MDNWQLAIGNWHRLAKWSRLASELFDKIAYNYNTMHLAISGNLFSEHDNTAPYDNYCPTPNATPRNGQFSNSVPTKNRHHHFITFTFTFTAMHWLTGAEGLLNTIEEPSRQKETIVLADFSWKWLKNFIEKKSAFSSTFLFLSLWVFVYVCMCVCLCNNNCWQQVFG